MSYIAEKKQYGTGVNWYRESPLDLTVTGSHDDAEVVVYGYITARFTYNEAHTSRKQMLMSNEQDLQFYTNFCMDMIGRCLNN